MDDEQVKETKPKNEPKPFGWDGSDDVAGFGEGVWQRIEENKGE